MELIREVKEDFYSYSEYEMKPSKKCLNLGWTRQIKRVEILTNEDKDFVTTSFRYTNEDRSSSHVYKSSIKEINK